jgi:hypothetical protein
VPSSELPELLEAPESTGAEVVVAVTVGAAVGVTVGGAVGAVVGAAIGAVVGAADTGVAVGTNVGATVGATVGGGNVPPGVIEIVSIEMSPVNEVPRVATHFTDVVPVGSMRKVRAHALVSAACCAPVCVH